MFIISKKLQEKSRSLRLREIEASLENDRGRKNYQVCANNFLFRRSKKLDGFQVEISFSDW